MTNTNKNTLVQITSVEIGAEDIKIEALAIEDMIMADDLFEDAETPVVHYSFSRKAKNGAEMKYLWRVCQGQRQCEPEKSMGKKLERLCGVITTLSDAFKEQS